jgi:hypothetical protein
LNDIKDQCDTALDDIHKILEESPDMIEKMLKTLQEMNNGSVHDEKDVN